MTPGANVIKLFLSVICKFLYKARVFVRIVWKGLPRMNTLSLLRKFVNYGRKFFTTLATDEKASTVSDEGDVKSGEIRLLRLQNTLAYSST
jgi:hypothetical protein